MHLLICINKSQCNSLWFIICFSDCLYVYPTVSNTMSSMSTGSSPNVKSRGTRQILCTEDEKNLDDRRGDLNCALLQKLQPTKWSHNLINNQPASEQQITRTVSDIQTHKFSTSRLRFCDEFKLEMLPVKASTILCGGRDNSQLFTFNKWMREEQFWFRTKLTWDFLFDYKQLEGDIPCHWGLI